MAHERLSFPVARALLELTGVSGTGGTLSSLVRSRFFLVGFAITFLLICWFMLTWFYVAVPPPPILSGNFAAKVLPLARGFPPFQLRFSILTLVFGYFTNLEVLFSIWFFHLLAIVQAGVFNRIGLEVGSVDPWGSFHAAVGWQSFGGMIVFVGWGLWIARSHLRDVFRKAFWGDERVDDTGELMSYRTAVWMMLGCSVYLLLWLNSAGMAWGPILAFYFATLVLYLGLARIMVESGLIFLRGPITAQAFTWHLFGVLGMGPGSAVILTLTNAFACDAKTFAMTPMAHVPRLGMAVNRRLRKVLAPGVMLGALIGAVTAVGFILYYGYFVMGSYNFGTVSFRGIGALNLAGFNQLAVGRIQAGTMGTSWDRIGFLGLVPHLRDCCFFAVSVSGVSASSDWVYDFSFCTASQYDTDDFYGLGFEDDCFAAWWIGALSQVDTAFSGDDGCLYGGHGNRRCCGLDLVPRAGAYDPCRVVSGRIDESRVSDTK